MRVIRGLGLGFIGLLLFPSLNIIIIIYLFIFLVYGGEWIILLNYKVVRQL